MARETRWHWVLSARLHSDGIGAGSATGRMWMSNGGMHIPPSPGSFVLYASLSRLTDGFLLYCTSLSRRCANQSLAGQNTHSLYPPRISKLGSCSSPSDVRSSPAFSAPNAQSRHDASCSISGLVPSRPFARSRRVASGSSPSHLSQSLHHICAPRSDFWTSNFTLALSRTLTAEVRKLHAFVRPAVTTFFEGACLILLFSGHTD